MDVKIEDIIKVIGHDGSDIIFPGLIEPLRRRGFHLQELIDAAVWYQYWPIWIEAEPEASPDLRSCSDCKGWRCDHKFLIPVEGRFDNYLKKYNGIMLGERNGIGHWLAWDREKWYDPAGVISESHNLKPWGFLALQI